MSTAAARGHRHRAHTADVIVEAWAADLAGLLEEVVAACVETFADVTGAEPRTVRVVTFASTTPADDLVAVLEEVLLYLDADGLVPCSSAVTYGPASLTCRFRLADAEAVTPTGAPPKGVSYSGLVVSCDRDVWRCRALLDV